MSISMKFILAKPTSMTECTKDWAAVIKLCRVQPKELPSGTPCSPDSIKRGLLQADFLQGISSEVKQSLSIASESQGVLRQKEETGKPVKDPVLQGLGRCSKPVKVCCGCGSFAAKMRCAKCLQVYACSDDCICKAWHAYHKHTCRSQGKK